MSKRPLVILSHLHHKDAALEHEIASGRAELYVQPFATGLENPVPVEVRGAAEAILHFTASRAIIQVYYQPSV